MEKNVWKEGVWRKPVRRGEVSSVGGIGKEGKRIGAEKGGYPDNRYKEKSGYSDNSWKAYIRCLDTEIREAYPSQFLGTVSRTEEDRENGFLPTDGESVWIELCEDGHHIGRHVCDTRQGIWILRDGNTQRYLYLSYTLGTHWVISLPEHILELVSSLGTILRSRDPKYVCFTDTDQVQIWRDVYSWEDVVMLPR